MAILTGKNNKCMIKKDFLDLEQKGEIYVRSVCVRSWWF
ncbi:MAG: hypothetical protein UV50_C0017G0015 [Parcubacteria group bacterium GW2011_GWB1_42_9]|nr:MAG: hypothetical protein UV50_C0017G0015 [Parcubacteria group bacterium GW2011_GWB1_42_9]